jgi:hypothetical protein
LFLLFGLWGCLTEPDCFDTSTNLVAIGFFDEDDKARDVEVDSLKISGIEGFIILEDTIFNSIVLPVNPVETEVVYTLYFGAKPETIALRYESETDVVSQDCGALTYLTDLSLTGSSFETITVLSNRLATNAGINVKVSLE